MKKIPEIVKCANVLIYDDENIKYYNGKMISFQQEANIDSGRFITGETYSNIMDWTIIFNVNDLKESENIKLDDTTMKRIAKFNKEQEILRLEEKIQQKKNKIKELDDLLQDKEERWNKVKEYIANIYDLDLEEDYDDEYYDY